MQAQTIMFIFTRCLVVLFLLPLSACSETYSAEAIEAWVVDAETGQPIEGVVVTANWQLQSGSVGGSRPAGQIQVMEAVTDAKGRFYFPAWGPKSTPISFHIPFIEGSPHLENEDPAMVLFKSGYKWARQLNSSAPILNYNKSSLRKSQWHGKTIKLERFTGTLREYDMHLSLIHSRLLFLSEECHWQKTPKMILAIDQQYQDFRRVGIDSGLHLVATIEGRSPAYGCAPVREYLNGVQK